MDNDAQKSEVHESTDDASSSPASNARQHTDSPRQQQGDSWSTSPDVNAPPSNYERGAAERHRTNVAGVGPAESDDLANAPPGRLELDADLDKSFYPTDGPGAGIPDAETGMNVDEKRIKPADEQKDRENLFPGYAKGAQPPDQPRQNLSP